MTTPPGERIFPATEFMYLGPVAELLRVHVSAVRRWINAGEFDGWRPAAGAHYTVRTSEMRALLADVPGARLYRPKEAARMLGVDPKTIDRWSAKAGRPRYIRLPRGHRRLYAADVDELAARRGRAA